MLLIVCDDLLIIFDDVVVRESPQTYARLSAGLREVYSSPILA